MGGVPPPCSPSHDHDPFVRISYLLFLFFSSDSALFGKNTRGGVPESVWQLQVVATNCARPTTLSQYVVVATNKNRVPTQTRTPPLTEEQNEAIPGNLRSITRPFNPSCLRRRSRLSPRC